MKRRLKFRRQIAQLVTVLSTVASLTLALTGTASAEDSGYRYGTDSSAPTNTGTAAPYTATFTGGVSLSGYYGGFSRGIGGWGDFDSCSGQANGNSTNSSHADGNKVNNIGYGVAGYYWVGGPSRDPLYNQSTYSLTAAYNWGYRQGQDAYNRWLNASDIWSYVIWADIEPGFGWEGTFSGCGLGTETSTYHNAYWDGQVLVGFEAGVHSKSSGMTVGVYSDTNMWDAAFGCSECGGGPGYIPTTYEWTYGSRPSSSMCPMNTSGLCSAQNLPISPAPVYDCTSAGMCAQFFGGQTWGSSYAVAWQWSTYGLPRTGSCSLAGENCAGDFDQLYEPQYPGGQ